MSEISIHALLAESDLRMPVTLTTMQPFLSTLSLRRATEQRHHDDLRCDISIHALLAESDLYTDEGWPNFSEISIHALLAESDPMTLETVWVIIVFLSTLSLRRATSQQPDETTKTTYFYPRSPCGERQVGQNRLRQKLAISIHALLAESDKTTQRAGWRQNEFLSTLSLRRATTVPGGGHISQTHFYPRSPCGERPKHTKSISCKLNFYPRSPCGERL